MRLNQEERYTLEWRKFLLEVKKIFPNADLESIHINKTLRQMDFCWCYGGVSKRNYPDKYHNQIDKINTMAKDIK